jgi:hypothetical protein
MARRRHALGDQPAPALPLAAKDDDTGAALKRSCRAIPDAC